ncbi:sortase A [Marmoricola sp. URHA0025 HA25]
MRMSSLVAWTLTALGAVLLLFVAFLLVGSRVQANRTQDVLYGKLANQLEQATAPVSGTIEPGTPVAVLRVDRLGLRQVVVQGASAAQTAIGPGLRSDSVLPGQAGVSVVVGRRTTYGAPFRHLDRLRRGDQLQVTTGQGHWTYVVDLVRHSDDPAASVAVVPARLTLVTSDPAFSPDRQLLVSAVLRGTPQARSTTTLPRFGERPGEHALGSAVSLLLWAQLLLAVVFVATRLTLRFPKGAVWIGAAPVLLAVLWNVFESVSDFLPTTL